MRRLKSFVQDEHAAVTVDWVVLTAGVAFMALVVMGPISTALGSTSEFIAAQIALYKAFLP